MVLQQISKPELNRPKLEKRIKYSQSDYEFYRTGLTEAPRCNVAIATRLINLVDYKRKQIGMILSQDLSRDLKIQ